MNDVVLHCPACGGRFAAAARYIDNPSTVFLCGACGTGFSKADADAEAGEAAEPKEIQQSPIVEGRRVVVGHSVPSAHRVVGEVLRQHGFAPVHVTEGSMVVQACDPVMPARPCAVVLDVGITDVLAFEVISHVRAFPGCESLPIVLLASVYERTRYKRRPSRLYGADAYVELHHVPDQLAQTLESLLRKEDLQGGRNQAPNDRARAAPLRASSGEHEPQTLAHRLISDVALYNGAELARGVSENDALKYVRAAMEEARQRFAELTGPAGDAADFQHALDAFVLRLTRQGVHREDSARQEGAGGS